MVSKNFLTGEVTMTVNGTKAKESNVLVSEKAMSMMAVYGKLAM